MAPLFGGLVLFTANFFPYWNQEHGWPFVFMVRESEVGGPGGPTVLYGPWPFDDPPLVAFRPGLLVVNVLVGMALLAAITLAVQSWFSPQKRPFQYSLRLLLVWTSLGAVLIVFFQAAAGKEGPVWATVHFCRWLLFLAVFFCIFILGRRIVLLVRAIRFPKE
jgi:hypothetical protein